MSEITDSLSLRDIYKEPGERALRKQLDHLDEHCQRFIALSPFVVLASSGADGRNDASPRGGPPGFVKVLNDRRIAFGDSPGNNRLDTLSNITAQPGLGLLFLIPGVNETLRINGAAHISTASDLREAMSVERKAPASVVVIDVQEAYLHCAKSLMRSSLWDPGTRIERSKLPTMNQMIRDQMGTVDAPLESQEAMEERYKKELY